MTVVVCFICHQCFFALGRETALVYCSCSKQALTLIDRLGSGADPNDPCDQILVSRRQQFVVPGSQSVVVDVRIPAVIICIQPRMRKQTRFQRGEQNDNSRKNLGTSLERSRLATERWQGLYRRWLLSQRADGSGSCPDEGR